MRDNRFNGVGGGKNFFDLNGYLFQSLGCISFGVDLSVSEVNLSD